MQRTPTRRNFLGTGVAATVTGGSLVGRTRAAAVSTAVLSGRVTPANGADVGDDQIQANSRTEPNHFRTDGNGRFEVELESDKEYKLGYYRSNSGTTLAPAKKGVPHVYKLGSVYLGSEDEDLGELVLPRAYVVDLRVLNGEGEPLFGSSLTYRHSGWGGGGDHLSLNEAGYATIDGASFTGVELAEQARVEVEPPDRGDYEDATYKRRAAVSGPTEFVVRIDGSGASWTVSEGEASGTTRATGTTDTASGTTDGRSTPETAEPTTRRSAAGTATTEAPMAGSNRSGTRRGTQAAARPERGFFSNGAGADDFGMLDDPFFLTVGGFVLSVAGIAHNLLRGGH